ETGIQMDLHVEVPAGITVADNDLCTLLMNMLDNAIEAVSELDREKPHIELTMHVRGRYLFVETLNPYTGTLLKDEKTGLPVSSKGAGHGYGMKAMSEVAKKYSSKLQVKQEHGILIVRTALLMPEKQE
ncbi:ATP-binding protein, partial [Candidatus Stoquefichus massiliensis]|uniref:ATP-binding protein n=1 Tax=Candidatus Stoquefichus massiliensis TaxID=1470350 RepID=UPI001C9C3FAE